MAADKTSLAQFEGQLEELEKLVSALEAGEVSLDEAVRNFERGMQLAQGCDALLQQAELRVKTLIDDAQGERLEDMSDEATREEDS